jgi:hypothetical protein
MPSLFLKLFGQLSTSLCVATNLCCPTSSPNLSSPNQTSQARLASAQYLIARAQTLEQINKLLLDNFLKLKEAQAEIRPGQSHDDLKSDDLHGSIRTDEQQNGIGLRLTPAINRGSVLLLCDAGGSPKTFHLEDSVSRKLPNKEAQEVFENVYQKYQVARTQYLQHRQEYDEHVQEFHQEAKEDNRALPPLAVPNAKPLRVMAEDQCRQLQILEQELRGSEEQMLSAIQALQSERSKIAPDAYFQQWINSQSMAMNVQRIAMSFNHGIVQKDQLTAEQLHAATQSAILNGDAIQSANTYNETQRRTALANAEAERAQLHSQLASSFLIYINALSPLAQRFANHSTITSEQLETESNALQTEYDKLQEQYTEVEKMNPAKK